MGLETRGVSALVLEARDRLGGRALSVPVPGGVLDLGPSWVWPQYQPRVSKIIRESSLTPLAQYEDGALRYENPEGDVRSIEYPSRYGDAVRLAQGLGSIASHLESQLERSEIRLNTTVSNVTTNESSVAVEIGAVGSEAGETIHADALIVATPPALAAKWSAFASERELQNGLLCWPTWMAAHAKFAAVYERPFWRESGFSGSAISHRGPLMEVVDISDPSQELFALFGFFALDAHERQSMEPAELKRLALDQLGVLFGSGALSPVRTHLQDWSQERYTAAESDLKAPSGHPPYGEPALQKLWSSDRIAFASAEAAQEHGGLVEGALLAGEVAAQRLLEAGDLVGLSGLNAVS